MKRFFLIIFCISLLLASCSEKKKVEYTPWGEVENDSVNAKNDFSMNDIINNGELIMLTISGPETYYEYHGRGFGTQYMLCEKFAQKLGVSLRVDVCRDTSEMIKKLSNGDADIIAFPLPKSLGKKNKSLMYCGVKVDSLHVQWAVKSDNNELADALNSWFTPDMIAKIKKEENFYLGSGGITRHIYSPMLNRKGGIISNYDNLFMNAGAALRWDWRLYASQCYQESCFDSRAHSWAGACGLMQIMPSTAAHLGLPTGDLYDPQANVIAATKYLMELTGKFRDIRDPQERIYFVQASYNGGYNHIRDAMALARKYGRDQYRWTDVSFYVLMLMRPEYYNDPCVRYGYMRGSETVEYVDRIHRRWAGYRGVAHSGSFKGSGINFHHIPSMGSDYMIPHKAHHKNKFHV